MAAKITKTLDAVPVSKNLQFGVIITAAALQFVELAMLIPYYATNPSGYRFDYALNTIVYTVYPLVIFLLLYIFSPQYNVRRQRVFIAVLKAIVATAAISFCQSIKNYYPLITGDYQYNVDAQPWWSSFTIDFVIIGAAIAAVTVYSILHNRRLKR